MIRFRVIEREKRIGGGEDTGGEGRGGEGK